MEIRPGPLCVFSFAFRREKATRSLRLWDRSKIHLFNGEECWVNGKAAEVTLSDDEVS